MQNEAYEAAEAILRRSWEVHRQAFGPILEPAFTENTQVRLPLIQALNHISRRQIKEGLGLLKSIQEYCQYDEDRAAWCFFVGLAFEMAGDKAHCLHWYAEAGRYNHSFYLPYLKLAKQAHQDGRFEEAHPSYLKAVQCLQAMPEAEKDENILASAYLNLCSCLTMMHRLPEAEQAWNQARSLPSPPEAQATAAILFAAMGKKELCEQALQALQKEASPLLSHAQLMTRQIFDGTHPHFYPVPVTEQELPLFWMWFQSYRFSFEKQDPDCLAAGKQLLKKAFPFLDREPVLTVTRQGGKPKLCFHDCYSVALHHGYARLLECCPEPLLKEWFFELCH